MHPVLARGPPRRGPRRSAAPGGGGGALGRLGRAARLKPVAGALVRPPRGSRSRGGFHAAGGGLRRGHGKSARAPPLEEAVLLPHVPDRGDGGGLQAPRPHARGRRRGPPHLPAGRGEGLAPSAHHAGEGRPLAAGRPAGRGRGLGRRCSPRAAGIPRVDHGGAPVGGRCAAGRVAEWRSPCAQAILGLRWGGHHPGRAGGAAGGFRVPTRRPAHRHPGGVDRGRRGEPHALHDWCRALRRPCRPAPLWGRRDQ
mmetsp:Transcript_28388/g.88517  ORF Transcript_28388/g.88517 Transcript_28388/m.88517 type:complete len:254 (+) Transcript_28388:446-1207(+)